MWFPYVYIIAQEKEKVKFLRRLYRLKNLFRGYLFEKFISWIFVSRAWRFNRYKNIDLPIPTPGGHCPQAVDYSIFLYRLDLS